MNEEMERLIAQGEALVEERERNELIARIAKEERAKMDLAEMSRVFWMNLETLLPAAIVKAVFAIDELSLISASVRLRFEIYGCPIIFKVWHVKGENLRFDAGENPYMVPQIEACAPNIYEGELYSGMADYTFKDAQRYSGVCEAMARAKRLSIALARIRKENTELEQQLRERLAQAARETATDEPVYVPADEPVSILNVDELVKLVRGIVKEYIH